MAAGSTYTPIATTTLGSATNSYTFSSIPSTYTDLVIVFSGSSSSAGDFFGVQYNSDTSSSYSNTYIGGSGTAAITGQSINYNLGRNGVVYSAQANTIISIQNYSNATTYKTAISRSNTAANSTTAFVSLWRSTAAITSIKILVESAANFTVGSTFTLYGIAAA
jgi:hypothetical protein